MHIVGAQLMVANFIGSIMIITESVLFQYIHATCIFEHILLTEQFSLTLFTINKVSKVPVSGCLDQDLNAPLLSSFLSQFINFWPLLPFVSLS